MQPSGLVIRLALTHGVGIHPGIIAAMAGMVVGTIPGIHLIIILAGAMVGMIPGTMAIMAGTILGTMAIMATTDIPITMVGTILTGEVVISQVVAAMPITTSAQVLSALMVLLTLIVMEAPLLAIASARAVFAIVLAE